jgi:membrane protein YqaA with SNARE-associated domain
MTPLEALGTIAASFAICTGTSFLPIGGGVEVYLLATSALLPPAFVGPLVLASAAGSVTAKTVVLLGARKAAKLPPAMSGEKRTKLVARIREGPWIRRGVILLSTTLSVPPYYALAVAAGALATPLGEFILVGMIGQTLRFGVVWLLPQLGVLAIGG